jgi:hypothetical protein
MSTREIGSVLNANPMRVGKTPECVFSYLPESGKLLIVAPLPTRGVWLKWLSVRFPQMSYALLSDKVDNPKKWNSASIAVVTGRSYDAAIWDKQIIWCHYDILPSFGKVFKEKLGMVVFDEGHLLSKRDTQRSQICRLFASQAHMKIIATGTPIWNKPSSVYNILDTLHPGAWGTWRQFGERYANGRQGIYGFEANGVSNTEEFNARLKSIMIRHEWEEILDNVPAVNRSVELVELGMADMHTLDEAFASYDKSDPLRSLSTWRKLAGSHKIQRTVDLALQVDGPSVVWTWHKDVAHEIGERFVEASIESEGEHSRDAYVITGDMNPANRDLVLDEWRKTNSLLVMTLAVGQAGIDLSHSTNTIFAEFDWTPAVIAQAEMRTYHMSRPMTATYVTTGHPVEMGMLRSLMNKVRMAGETILSSGGGGLEVLFEGMEFAMIDPTDLLMSLFEV